MSENTTILISKDTREKIKELGKKGETYDDILGRVYRERRQMENIAMLMNTEGYMTIDEARKWTKKQNKLEGL